VRDHPQDLDREPGIVHQQADELVARQAPGHAFAHALGARGVGPLLQCRDGAEDLSRPQDLEGGDAAVRGALVLAHFPPPDRPQVVGGLALEEQGAPAREGLLHQLTLNQSQLLGGQRAKELRLLELYVLLYLHSEPPDQI